MHTHTHHTYTHTHHTYMLCANLGTFYFLAPNLSGDVCVGCLTLKIVILIHSPGTISDTIHTNRDFNPLAGDASYALYTQLLFNVPAGSFFLNMQWIYQTCPNCDKKLIGMVISTGDIPTFRMSPVGGLKTQNCRRKTAVTCAHTHTHTHPHTSKKTFGHWSLNMEITFNAAPILVKAFDETMEQTLNLI